MRADVQIASSFALTFGVPLVLAIRELVVLRRGGGWFPRADVPPEPVPDPPRQRDLPACLRPPFGGSPDGGERVGERELELA